MALVRFGGGENRRVGGFTSQEDATPIDPSDSTGGSGQISVTARATEDTEFLEGESFELEDKGHGKTAGVVEAIAIHGVTATLTANARTSAFVAQRTMPLYNGTLGNAIRAYCATVNITSGIVIDASLESVPVSLPGWKGEVWYYLKQLAVAYHFEISLVSANIVFRPLRGRTTVNYRNSDVAFGVSRDQMARSVEGYYYNNTYKAGAITYPIGGWSTDVQVYQVDAGEVQEFDIEISATLASIVQPVPTNFVGRYDSSASVYSIAGNDGLPFLAAQWTAQGGSLTVSINEDQTSLHVRIVGANNTQYAPYRIAMSSGPSDFYSSLRIIGTGVFYTPTKVTVPTGANPDRATQDVGATVQNPFLSTLTNLFDSLIWTVARFAAPRGTMTVSTKDIKRRDDAGNYSYPTIAAFNAEHVGETIANFNTEYAGMTIAEFNAAQGALVKDNFENQIFGNISGSRVLARDNWWRIRTATDQGSIQYTAEIDTTIADFNEVWAGATIADFNEQWYKMSISKFNLKPLRKTVLLASEHSFPSSGTFPDSGTFPG